ncbi:5-hydroxytryptamine receptor 2B [Elysia marginata]|uniref:5-hydroxytryptamine receptor 2B n=1 Tax=Elysia marginata TaxID=1093978 RepID=A0AAV4HUE2_9GAST|nr:5-hydroxytryptamine receptor 2B [Elysia marginata]
MNLSAGLETARQDAITNARQRDLTLVTFLVSLSVIGVVVNTILLDVYMHTKRKVLSTYFITAVAAIDLMISSFVIPLRILPVVAAVPMSVCAVCLSVSYGCTGVSIMLFFCITFDRYQAVCLLQRPLITTQNLHFPVIWAFVSAVYAGIIAPIYLKGEITVLDDVTNVTNVSEVISLRRVTLQMRPGFPCYSTAMLSYPRRVWDARFIIQFVFAVCCGSLILLVLVLYFLMFIKLRQKNQFRLQSLSYGTQGKSSRQLHARPCYHISGLPAHSTADNSQDPKSSDKDEGRSCSEELPSASEETLSFSKSGVARGKLFSENLRPGQHEKDNDVIKYEEQVKTNANVGTARQKGRNLIQPRFPGLGRSSSSLHPRELTKFRRWICVKVEPLQIQDANLPREIKISQKRSPFKVLAKRVGRKLERYYPESQLNKPNKRVTRFASLSCFKSNHEGYEVESISLDNFSTQVTSDTDSVHSEPETCQSRISRVHNLVVKPINNSADSKTDSSASNSRDRMDSSASNTVLTRVRSLSCSAAIDTTKREHYGTLVQNKDSKEGKEFVTTNRTHLDVPPDLIRDVPNTEIQSREINISGKITRSSSPIQDNFEDSVNDKPTVRENSVSVSFETSVESSEIQGKSQNRHIPSSQDLSFQIRIENLNNSIGKIGSPKIINLSEKKMTLKCFKKKSAKTKVVAHEENSNSPQQEMGKGPVIRRSVEHWKGCWDRFGCNLSTKVTARVGLLTLAYCLWWLPFYLTELGLVNYDTLVPEMFFMANVMNPLLHLMTSQVFRHQVRARFKVYKAKLAARWNRNFSRA